MVCLLAGLIAGNPQGEGGTLVDFAPDRNGAAMKFRDLANQRQAETGAWHIRILHARNAVKLIEYPPQIRLRNAISVVGHLDGDVFFPGARRNGDGRPVRADRKSTRLNSSHLGISYAVFCLKKK